MVCAVAFAPSFASCAFHVPDVPSFVSLLVPFHSSIVHLPFSETYHPIQPGTVVRVLSMAFSTLLFFSFFCFFTCKRGL